MKRISLTPAWSVFKRKLKEKYEHLTDDDLMAMELNRAEWLEQLQRVVGRSTFEIAHLAEEAANEADPCRCPLFGGNEEWRYGSWLATNLSTSQPVRLCRPGLMSKETARGVT
jgi:hypothetical protein